jgi:hypothetical protein
VGGPAVHCFGAQQAGHATKHHAAPFNTAFTFTHPPTSPHPTPHSSCQGPYFLGADISLVDITFAPMLERAAASLAYYKGYVMRGAGKWPELEAWFDAMESRPTYLGTKSDHYTHCHDLPPQLGGEAPWGWCRGGGGGGGFCFTTRTGVPCSCSYNSWGWWGALCGVYLGRPGGTGPSAGGLREVEGRGKGREQPAVAGRGLQVIAEGTGCCMVAWAA